MFACNCCSWVLNSEFNKRTGNRSICPWQSKRIILEWYLFSPWMVHPSQRSSHSHTHTLRFIFLLRTNLHASFFSFCSWRWAARDFDCHFIVFGNHQNANRNFFDFKETLGKNWRQRSAGNGWQRPTPMSGASNRLAICQRWLQTTRYWGKLPAK